MNGAPEPKTGELNSLEVSAASRSRHFDVAGTNYPHVRISQGFFVFAIVAALALAPHLLTQDRTSNFLVYIAAALALGGLTVTRRGQRGASASFSSRIRAALSGEQWTTLAVFAAFLAFYGGTMFDPSPYNEQVRQAFAFVHGHTYIDAPQSFIEHAQVGPYSYAIHPPLPAIVLMPFTAIWGMDTNQTEFSVVIGAIDIALAWILLGRLKVSPNPRVWLTVFFGLGNILWYETVIGTTWALPMNFALLFQLATLIELFGEARPLWLGIYAALTALARYDLALAAPVYPIIAMARGRKFTEMFAMVPPFLVAGALFVGFNEVRYHALFDVGILKVARDQGYPGAFGLQYFPGNLYTLLFMAPTVNGTFPYIHPVFGGQALPLTSPAFVLALRPSFKRLTVSMMGLCAVLVAIPALFHFTNGFAQFGTRLYLPTFPFLFVMMAMGMRRRTDQLSKILICASIFLITFGVWQIRVWGLNGP